MPKLSKSLSVLLIFLAIAALQISPYAEYIGNRLPILTYHHFDDDIANDMVVSPAVFEEHIRALSEAVYTAIDFHELCEHVESGAPLPEKAICITMDDGYLSNCEVAYPNGKYSARSEEILHSLGFKVTLTTNPHLNVIRVGDSSSLRRLGRYTVTNDITAEQLLKMIK